MHLFLFFLVSTIWGTAFVAMSFAGTHFNHFAISSGRMMLGAACLGLLLRLKGKPILVPKGLRLTVFGLSLLGTAIPFSLQPYLIVKTGNSAFFGQMIALVPLFTILVRLPILGKAPSRREFWGVMGGLACASILFYDGQTKSISLLYSFLGMLTPLLYATCNTLLSKIIAGIDTTRVSCTVLLTGGLVLLPFFRMLPHDAPIWPAVCALAWLGLLGSGVAFLILYYLIQKRGPLYGGMVGYVIPVVAVLCGVIIGEPISMLQWTALFGILVMVYVVQRGGDHENNPTQ